ncbi:MAG: S-adenosyl-methyltransferase MraW, rRNA (cytosine1402-N4)-methyltransferase [Candidatus Parcubacteria bacterium]|jgi:16S rRNA (cytosine1402-N4)-methyltransferase
MHIPVLLNECLEGLSLKEGGIYVDCTTNRGGHSVEIAKHIGKEGTLICIDLDNQALKEARDLMEGLNDGPKLHFICSNYRHIESILSDLKIEHVDGVLADLGLSTQELECSKRGFSFQNDEPLIMTFSDSPDEGATTAYDIINFWSESTIADILYGFADETYSRRIAKAIVEHRINSPIQTTFELVSVIKSATPSAYHHKKTHFATKTFQALRMAVNDELGGIKDLCQSFPKILKQQGRACLITFHSTEDRMVKQTLREYKESLIPITKKPIIPSEDEISRNPRSRSAQLRIVERT